MKYKRLSVFTLSALICLGAPLRALAEENPYIASLLADASSDSLFQLGIFYRNGQVVEQDITKGIQYLKQSSQMEGAKASAELGKMYHYGYHVETDIELAKEYYEIGRSQGSHVACVGLADIAASVHGENSKPDYLLAEALYREAIAKGSAVAHIGLGNLHKNGQGLEKNPVAAEKEYLLAIEKGEKSGHLHIFAMIDWGQLKDRSMQEAFSHLEQAAENKIPAAEDYLGQLKINGEWTRYKTNEKISYPRDVQGGISLLNNAISKRRATASLFAAEIYTKGEIVEKDPEKAAKFVELAIKNTSTDNIETIGRIELFIDEKLASSDLDKIKAATLKAKLYKDND